MVAIFQTTLWNAFSWTKVPEFRWRFHWGLFLRVQNSTPALVQIMAWRRSGAKPLSEPMMVSLLTHMCVTRPQWVKSGRSGARHRSGSQLIWIKAWAHSFVFNVLSRSYVVMGILIARYAKLRVAHAPGTFSRHRGLAIPTCIMARAWHTCRDACLGR